LRKKSQVPLLIRNRPRRAQNVNIQDETSGKGERRKVPKRGVLFSFIEKDCEGGERRSIPKKVERRGIFPVAPQREKKKKKKKSLLFLLEGDAAPGAKEKKKGIRRKKRDIFRGRRKKIADRLSKGGTTWGEEKCFSFHKKGGERGEN